MKKAFSILLSLCLMLIATFISSAASVSTHPVLYDDSLSMVGTAPTSNLGSSGEAGSGGMTVLFDEFGFEVNKAKVPEDALVLITLSASNSGTVGVLNAYTKETYEGEEAYWVRKLNTAAVYGERGIYKTREGDRKTPVGTFKMNTPFGISAPLSGFPSNYIQVDEGHYWDGDSKSSHYNKLVNTAQYNDFDKSQSEHIIDYTGYYNYAIDTGYNPDCTPYLGSAIYLHCFATGDFDTLGCIAIPEGEMIRIMRLYQEGKTWIVIYDVENPSGVY